MESLKVSFTDKLCTPNIFGEFSFVTMDFGGESVKFLSNDLDAYLFSRGRLNDLQLAALSSQLSQHSSVFDSLSDEQRIEFLNSRYNQNFASVDSFRQYLVSNLQELEESVSVSDLAATDSSPVASTDVSSVDSDNV